MNQVKKLFVLLTGALLSASLVVGVTACSDPEEEKPDPSTNSGTTLTLSSDLFDIATWSTGADERLKISETEEGYMKVEYSDIMRNDFVSVAADVDIDVSEINTFTMEWEILGEESVNFSLEFAGTPGDGWGYSAGYGGGDKQPGEGEDVVDFNGVYNGSDCFPMAEINKIQFFFDSGYDSVAVQTATHSNTILIKSIKLTYREPLTEAAVPADAVLTNATVGAISTDPAESSTLATSVSDGVYTIERTEAAPGSGDYGNHVNLAFDGVIPETRWIELTFGEGTSFNMLMIQVQKPNAAGDGNEEILNYQLIQSFSGEKLVIELTEAQGQQIAETSIKQLMIWLDANSGNGKGKMVIESVKFYAPAGTQLPEEPEEPETPDYGTPIEGAQVGDLWKNETVTTLETDNDTKTITRVTEAPENGDYGSWVALNYTGMSADCRKIVIALGSETNFNMLMIQVQAPNGDGGYQEVINYQVLMPTLGAQQLVIDLTAEQAQQMVETDHQYFMIWLDANSGNGTGNLVIKSVEFWAPEGTVIDPEDPSGEAGTLLDTTMGDLWKNETVTTLTTDNDAKTVARVTEASESGDYGSWVALNYADMSADCRTIVITLGEGTSCNMVMIQVQNADGSEIVKQDWNACKVGDQLVIELTAEQAQSMCDTANKYFMIWLDANSGNGCGTLVIESV